jgi:hypothetical protein
MVRFSSKVSLTQGYPTFEIGAMPEPE